MILIIEDNAGDVFVMQEALREHGVEGEVKVLNTGEEAFNYFGALNAIPQVVLLDLNIPRRSGHQVLQKIRSIPECANVPVVITSSSESPQDIAESRRLGATEYFVKPSRLEEYIKLGSLVQSFLLTSHRSG